MTCRRTAVSDKGPAGGVHQWQHPSLQYNVMCHDASSFLAAQPRGPHHTAVAQQVPSTVCEAVAAGPPLAAQ
jgi:hypothetical protein